MNQQRRRRLSADETRERLVDAGVRSIVREGMTIGLGSINLEQAIIDSDVSRSSAYTVWSQQERFSPQENFQRTVLRRALAEPSEVVSGIREASLSALAAAGPPASRRILLAEFARVAAGAHARSVVESRSWQLGVALRAALNSAPEDRRDAELAEWVSESERRDREEAIESVYRPLAQMLRIRPRPEFGEDAYHYCEISAAALVEGLASRSFMGASQYLDGIVRPGPGAGSESWSLFAINFERIVLTFFEPINPDEWNNERN